MAAEFANGFMNGFSSRPFPLLITSLVVQPSNAAAACGNTVTAYHNFMFAAGGSCMCCFVTTVAVETTGATLTLLAYNSAGRSDANVARPTPIGSAAGSKASAECLLPLARAEAGCADGRATTWEEGAAESRSTQTKVRIGPRPFVHELIALMDMSKGNVCHRANVTSVPQGATKTLNAHPKSRAANYLGRPSAAM